MDKLTNEKVHEGLTTLPPSCADCLEISAPQHSETLRACTGISLPLGYAKCTVD